MNEKRQLNEEDLKNITGGDDLEEAVKQSLQEQEEERLKKLIEEVDDNKQQRTSEDLSNTLNNIFDVLKKIAGTDDDSDGTIHMG